MSEPNDLRMLDELVTKNLADAVRDDPPSSSARSRMKRNLLARANASPPEGTTTIRADEGTWEPFGEGVTRKLLRVDDGSGVESALYRLLPGSSFPPHEHTHVEECWVLEGDILVGDHMVHASEMHIAQTGFAHPEIVARTDALLLIHSQVYVGPLSPA